MMLQIIFCQGKILIGEVSGHFPFSLKRNVQTKGQNARFCPIAGRYFKHCNGSHSHKGHSLNSYWAKGPDGYMNNLLSVLLKFRENRIGIVGDIKKMYNSVYIKELDQHVHRFLWKNMDTNKTPDYML